MSDENTQSQQGPIPYARFQEVVAAKNAAEAKVQEISGRLETFQVQLDEAKAQAQAKAQEAEAKAQEMANLSLQHQMETTLLREGIQDKEVMDFLSFKYNGVKVEGDAQKPSFQDWFKDYKAGEPVVLKPFQKADTQTQQTQEVQTQQANTQTQQTQVAKKAGSEDAVVPDQSHSARTGTGEAVSNLTPHSLAKMTSEQIKQMGGMSEILKRLPGRPA